MLLDRPPTPEFLATGVCLSVCLWMKLRNLLMLGKLCTTWQYPEPQRCFPSFPGLWIFHFLPGQISSIILTKLHILPRGFHEHSLLEIIKEFSAVRLEANIPLLQLCALVLSSPAGVSAALGQPVGDELVLCRRAWAEELTWYLG